MITQIDIHVSGSGRVEMTEFQNGFRASGGAFAAEDAPRSVHLPFTGQYDLMFVTIGREANSVPVTEGQLDSSGRLAEMFQSYSAGSFAT